MSERTIEISRLFDLFYRKPFYPRTFLEVGCRDSELYLKHLKLMIPDSCKFTGIDRDDSWLSQSRPIYPLDIFIKDKFEDHFFNDNFEFISCISTIEHNEYFHRETILRELLKVASQFIYLTFPIGKAFLNQGANYSIIGVKEFNEWLQIIDEAGFDSDNEFYFSPEPNALTQVWVPETYMATFNTMHDPTVGVQTVAIMKLLAR